MLDKQLFKEQLVKAYLVMNIDYDKQKKSFPYWYEECKYLDAESFEQGIKNLYNNCNIVSLPNILHNLPKYNPYEMNDRIKILPPKNIEEYCKKYISRIYYKDKLKEYLSGKFDNQELIILNSLSEVLKRNNLDIYDFRFNNLKEIINKYKSDIKLFKFALNNLKENKEKINVEEICQHFNYRVNYIKFYGKEDFYLKDISSEAIGDSYID